MKRMRAASWMLLCAGLAGGRLPALEAADGAGPAGGLGGAREKAAYLGVATQPVGDTLGRQLKLPSGVGLIVVHVDPSSPAAGALREHDVLHKLNDQILIDHRQLSVLIRMMKPGETANLTRLRDGESRVAEVKLAEKELPPLGAPPWEGQGLKFEPPLMPPAGPGRDGRMMDRLRELLDQSGMGADKMRDIVRQMDEAMKGWPQISPPGMDPSIRMRLSDPDGEKVTTSISDGFTLTLSQDASGRKDLLAVDAAGKEVFRGPINTSEEREKIPPDIRRRLDELEQTRKGLLQE